MPTTEQKQEIKANREKNLESLRHHKVVSEAEWTKARIALMDEEKRLMKLHDEFVAKKRALPWVKVEKDYVFTTREGRQSLTELFGPHSQLFIKHFMMGPNQDWQCQGCSLEADHVKQLLPHFVHHDMAYVAVSRAPLEKIEAVRKKMDWDFKWVSSQGSDFNFDFHVSFRPEEIAAHKAIYNFREFDPEDMTDLSGNSVFYKNERGEVFHTYGTFGRGGEQFLGIFAYFDVLPKSREEYGPRHSLPDWAKIRTEYDAAVL